MAASVVDFRTRFPEFSDDTEFTDDRVQLFIDDTVLYMGTDENRWGDKYNTAQIYLTAHLLSVAMSSEASGGNASASAGVISSKSAGGVSVTRQIVNKVRSEEDDFYMSTVYGQQFLILRDRCFVGVLVAC